MGTVRIRCSGNTEGIDGLPVPHTNHLGCGRMFDVDIEEGDPGLVTTWDVKTDADGNVKSRHKSVLCPTCGVATFIVEGA